MKKLIAYMLAAILLVSLCACGGNADNGEDTVTTTQNATTTTTQGGGSSATATTVTTTTQGDSATDGTSSSATATTTAPTVIPGVTVPIGTKPPVTTTQNATTTTTVGQPSAGGSTTATSAATTTTTTITTKPTEPVVQGPYIVLPAVGSDIDVTNHKNRIRVKNVAAWYDSVDGETVIGVQMILRNYSSNWITEETDYVEYTCYDKAGKVVQRATRLFLGVIDTKTNVEKTFTFHVPVETAEVRITKSKIIYWTEWM